MKKSKSGSKHVLLYFHRSIGRIWKTLLLLGLALVLAGWKASSKNSNFLGLESDIWFFTAAVILFLLSAFSFMMRYWAYVQAKSSFLNIVTPFLRFRISYRRIRSAYPVSIQQLFPLETSSWSQRNFLKPFYGKTALVVELLGYPINPKLMRLFLPGQMFSPRTTGLVLIVPDWMKLSTELDSIRGVWLEDQSKRRRSGK